MAPPPALPLDHHHLIISNSGSSKQVNHSSLLLRSTSLLDLSLSPTNILTTDPSLSLSLLCFPATTQPGDHNDQSSSRDYNKNDEISSFSNSSVSVKRPERDEERPDDDAAANNNISDEYEAVFNNNIGLDGGSRKKLRLNKEQSALLEDSFKIHSTLNPKQKEALARQLNLRPRQVQVWFQNRRARTKLKQTEVDCEFLKKCCERLAEQNQKLQKELQELKLLFYLQLPSARLTMCPSCERPLLPAKNNNHANFLTSSKKRMIFNPFTKPSAAC